MTRKPLTAAEKAYLRRRKEAGATHQAVAEALGCSTETVKKWWRYERYTECQILVVEMADLLP